MIRVMIERRLAHDAEHDLHMAMREIRLEAIHRPGYISGETWCDIDDPHHFIVISTWQSLDDWKQWATSDTRRKIEQRITPLLTEPERVTVYAPA